MSAALSCVLAIDEGVVFFSSLFGVGKSNFNILAREVNNRVAYIFFDDFLQKIAQPVLRPKSTPIKSNGKSWIQVAVVPKHLF